jgi:hypothetical protein
VYKDDFTPVFGTETILQLKGSTRIRAVLAYHAALLALYCSFRNGGFRFLLLDTPKQHEIHNDDLDRYFKALKSLAVKHNVQIVFSTTEYRYIGDRDDEEWIPPFEGRDQKMFLRDNAYNKNRLSES